MPAKKLGKYSIIFFLIRLIFFFIKNYILLNDNKKTGFISEAGFYFFLKLK